MSKKSLYLLIGIIVIGMLLFVYLRSNQSANSSEQNSFSTPTHSVKGKRPTKPTRPDFTQLLDESEDKAAEPDYQDPAYSARLQRPAQGAALFTAQPTIPSEQRYGVSKYNNNSNRLPSQINTERSIPSAYTTSSSANYSAAGSQTGPRKVMGRDVDMSTYPMNKKAGSGGLGDLGEMEGYLSKLSYQEQKELDLKINNMSAGLERAILRAMAPKSKQDEMIEKYLNRRGTNGEESEDSGKTIGGFPVNSAEGKILQQLANQTQNIVQAMRETFGNEAASGAQKIMQDFQREMQAVLAGPGTAEEKQARLQALNKKYNDKLQKFNQKESDKKLRSQMQAENAKQLTQIRKEFGATTAAAVQAKLDENIAQRIEIMNQGLPEEEMYKQLLALEQQERQDIEDIIRQNNPQDVAAVDKWRALQNQEMKERILQADQAVKDGAEEAQLFRVNDTTIKEFQKDWQVEDQTIQQGLSGYGSEMQARALQIQQDLRAQQAQLYSEGGTAQELDRKSMELTEKANSELEALRNEYKETYIQNTAAEFNAANERNIQQATVKFLSEASEDTKEAFRQQANAILEHYNTERAKLLADRDKNPDYTDQWEEIYRQEQNQLAILLQSLQQQEQQ